MNQEDGKRHNESGMAAFSDANLDASIIENATRVFGNLGGLSLELEYEGTMAENGFEIKPYDGTSSEVAWDFFLKNMKLNFKSEKFSMETFRRYLGAEGGLYAQYKDAIPDPSTERGFSDFCRFLFSMFDNLMRSGGIEQMDIYDFAKSYTEKSGNNTLIVLDDSFPVIFDPFDADDSFNCAYVGRGFVCFANYANIDNDPKNPFSITIPTYLTKGEGLSERHIQREAAHEYVGHIVGGLTDHRDGRECIMTNLRTFKELYDNLRKGDFSFCSECVEKSQGRVLYQ
ncbi:MAG: hypothetical protein JXC85_04065 [Candidatus Aenigmarchaeota archaeon]|nr:hypothetical protein [Candidatus Aenigmarchaeota archaeon]